MKVEAISQQDAQDVQEIIIRREGSVGSICLNRPKAINAITLGMVRAIDAALTDFERDPAVALVLIEGAGERGLCAGGDIRVLYESSFGDQSIAKSFWREEYIINAHIASFAKPYVAWMNGIVMGGGIGLSAHGSHRVVSDTTKAAMPETGIGFFPDVGGTWLLSRTPGELGTYLALTGTVINGYDAVGAGIADVVVEAQRWPTLREALTQLRPGARNADVSALISGFAAPEGARPVMAELERINRLFAFDRVEDIIAALQSDGSDFAQATLKTLLHKSPTSLKVTLKLLRMARQESSLRACLTHEYRAAQEVLVSAEFREGVRAAIIDKDRNPQWQPARVEDVNTDIVGRYFVDRGADEYVF